MSAIKDVCVFLRERPGTLLDNLPAEGFTKRAIEITYSNGFIERERHSGVAILTPRGEYYARTGVIVPKGAPIPQTEPGPTDALIPPELENLPADTAEEILALREKERDARHRAPTPAADRDEDGESEIAPTHRPLRQSTPVLPPAMQRARVLSVVRANPGLMTREIADLLDAPKLTSNQVSLALHDLTIAGTVRRDGTGHKNDPYKHFAAIEAGAPAPAIVQAIEEGRLEGERSDDPRAALNLGVTPLRGSEMTTPLMPEMQVKAAAAAAVRQEARSAHEVGSNEPPKAYTPRMGESVSDYRERIRLPSDFVTHDEVMLIARHDASERTIDFIPMETLGAQDDDPPQGTEPPEPAPPREIVTVELDPDDDIDAQILALYRVKEAVAGLTLEMLTGVMDWVYKRRLETDQAQHPQGWKKPEDAA